MIEAPPDPVGCETVARPEVRPTSSFLYDRNANHRDVLSRASPGPYDPLASVNETLEAIRVGRRFLEDPDYLIEWALGFDTAFLEGVLGSLSDERLSGVSERLLIDLLAYPERSIREKAIGLLARWRAGQSSRKPR